MNQNDLPQGCGSPMPFFPRGAKKGIKDQPYFLVIGQKANFVLRLVSPHFSRTIWHILHDHPLYAQNQKSTPLLGQKFRFLLYLQGIE